MWVLCGVVWFCGRAGGGVEQAAECGYVGGVVVEAVAERTGPRFGLCVGQFGQLSSLRFCGTVSGWGACMGA